MLSQLCHCHVIPTRAVEIASPPTFFPGVPPCAVKSAFLRPHIRSSWELGAGGGEGKSRANQIDFTPEPFSFAPPQFLFLSAASIYFSLFAFAISRSPHASASGARLHRTAYKRTRRTPRKDVIERARACECTCACSSRIYNRGHMRSLIRCHVSHLQPALCLGQGKGEHVHSSVSPLRGNQFS